MTDKINPDPRVMEWIKTICPEARVLPFNSRTIAAKAIQETLGVTVLDEDSMWKLVEEHREKLEPAIDRICEESLSPYLKERK